MNTKLNKIAFYMLMSFSLSACAHQSADTVVEVPKSVPTENKEINKNIINDNSWQDWNLIIVSLDKNQKPSDKVEMSLLKAFKISKPKAPEISLDESILDNNIGRVLKIHCDNSTITQKFDSTNQLKGWAVQMNCFKQNYYFIINTINR